MTIAETQHKLRIMVTEYIREHSWEWDKFRDAYEKEKGYTIGRSLSLQSLIMYDLLIDICFLASDAEKGTPFTREYWVRSHGTQCIKDEQDADATRQVFGDILAKIKVEFDGMDFVEPTWFEDEDCKIPNKFLAVKSDR